MHEVPIVREIVRNLEQTYSDRFHKITKVQVQAGLLSNIQPILIQNAFEALRLENPQLAAIDLEIVQLPIIAHCAICNKNFEVRLYRFICECGHPTKTIIQGKELQISRVEFLTE